MKIVIEIPKEFERDVKGKGCLGESNRFVEFFRRVLNDIRYGKCACGNYEEETAEMFADQFDKIQVLDDKHDAEIRRQTIDEFASTVIENHESLPNEYADRLAEQSYQRGYKNACRALIERIRQDEFVRMVVLSKESLQDILVEIIVEQMKGGAE